MPMNKASIRIAAVAMAGAIAAVPQLPAFAAPATTPTISIAAKSGLPRITGDVLVVFRSSLGSAKIKGTITGAADGEVVKLYAQRFPFNKAAAPIGTPITLSSPGASTPYSFNATPTLATRYTVELFADSTATSPLATSATVTVYVAAHSRSSRFTGCGRPTCRTTFHLKTIVPASTLKTEMPKRWFVYFGVRFSSTGRALPKTLRLGAGHARVSRARKINGHEYAVNISFSFFVGNHGFNFAFFPCQKDTEAKDGLNLPGHHGCGTLRSISIHRIYLG
jgi:hypothetical protein